MYTHTFTGVLVIDVVNSEYAGIRCPKFDAWSTGLEEAGRIRLIDQSKTTDVTLELNSLHWHEIKDAVVDFVPAFEICW